MSKRETEGVSQKMAGLEGEIEWFYGEEFRIDEAAEKYRGALALAKEVEQELGELKNEVEIIRKDFSQQD